MFVACGSSFTVQDVAGTYDLTSVDGSELPFEWEMVDSMLLVSGSVTLETDSTFRAVETNIVGEGGEPVEREIASGAFSLAAPDTVFLVTTTNDTMISRLTEGGVLTLGPEEGPALVYTKQ